MGWPCWVFWFGKTLSRCFSDSLKKFWMAVSAATIAGLPKPWLMREKWVRCLWIEGSRRICGLVLHKGDLSWLSRSISSLVTCLVAWRSSFLLIVSPCCLKRYSATCKYLYQDCIKFSKLINNIQYYKG